MATHTCKTCSKSFVVNQPGRPPTRCPECKAKEPASIVKPATKSVPIAAVVSTIVVGGDNTEGIEIKQADNDDTFSHAVIVSNMGVAFRCNDDKEAKKRYEHYVNASIAGYGQVGRENVSLRINGEIVMHFDPVVYFQGEGKK